MADLGSGPSHPVRHDDIADELAAAGFEECQEIGRGGFGVVYRCLQRSLERTVAVKVLTSDLDQDSPERFLREQRAMGRLSGHPNVVNIMQVGATAGRRPFIVMQFHPYGSLDVRIRKHGPLAWRESLRVGVKVAGALETAHRSEILHRDVKPANILLTEYGEPQLTDFGIARISGAFQTDTGKVIGTPAFTAPEILEGQTPTVASDLYGLGATLFCALTGHAVFERRSGEEVVAQFLRIAHQPVPDLRHAGIPDGFATAIERAMAADPANRPTTAAEYGEQLREVERRLGVGLDEMALRVDRDDSLISAPAPPTAGRLSQATSAWRLSGGPTTPPVPATKFRPPHAPKTLVTRQRLLDRLSAERNRQLTVIHAAAGYGKSTLAAQWRAELEHGGVPVAWLTVDDDDNNLMWFLDHLVEAIRRVRPELANELAEVLEEHGDEADRFVLASLINDVHERGEPTAVVIDDWHRVTNSSVLAAMDFLLERGSENLQFVVTTRTRRRLPLSRMRMRDELTEIDADALCFDVAEARTFLVDGVGLNLSDSDVERLLSATGGWIAGLKMASLSMRESDDPAALIGQISGRHHMIGEFLAENVLDSLEPETLDFLLRTSITDKTCGSLAGVLAAIPRGQAMLELVDEQDLFLRRVDEDIEWYRYQPLFAEFLRRRLDRDYPDLVVHLHHTASQWFAEHRMLREAVDHALAAGDPARAVRLVENDGWALVERVQLATLFGLINKLPAAMVERSPKLQIMLAFVPIEHHRAAAAEAALNRAVEALEKLPADDDEAAGMRAEVDVARAAMRAATDRIDGVEELIAGCLSRPETLPPFIVATAADIASYVEICKGNFDAVHRWQEWARPYHKGTTGPFPAMYGYAYDGIAAYEQLDIALAEDNFRAALRATRRPGGAPSRASSLAGALLAGLVYEQGDVDEAERLLDESYQPAAEAGEADFLIPRYTIGARIKMLRRDRAAADKLLAEGADVAERMSMLRLRAAVENERLKLGLADPYKLAAPVEYLRRRRPIEGIEEITAQIEEDTSIRLLMATPSPEQRDLAYEWAREWVDRLEGRGRHRALLMAKRLLVECLAAVGRTADAKQFLAAVLAQSAKLGLVRFPIDDGPMVVALVEELSRVQKAGRWHPHWPEVPSEFFRASSRGAAVGAAPVGVDTRPGLGSRPPWRSQLGARTPGGAGARAK